MLVTPFQFGLFCIYSCILALFLESQLSMLVTHQIWLILHLFFPHFNKSVIYACFSHLIWLILILFLPYFQLVSYLFLLLLFNLAHFIFILASYLACELISTLILFI